MNNKKYVFGLMALAVLVTLAATPAFADNNIQGNDGVGGNKIYGRMMNRGGGGMMKPGVFGTVSAVNGNTMTVAGKQGFGPNAVDATFNVDATNAKVMKDGVAGTVTSIIVGDKVMIEGAVNGTNVVATLILDGKIKMMSRGRSKEGDANNFGKDINITGNGQPVVAGTVTTVNGSTLTVTNKSNVTYTIDATSAKITQGPNIVTVSSVAVGDIVIAQGTINGNSVVATTVIDQPQKPDATNGGEGLEPVHKGFFGSVGSFFAHIFGF